MRSDLELMTLARMHTQDRLKATEQKRQVQCFRAAERVERMVARSRAHGVRPGVVAVKNNVLF